MLFGNFVFEVILIEMRTFLTFHRRFFKNGWTDLKNNYVILPEKASLCQLPATIGPAIFFN